VKKTRQNKNLEPRSDSIGTEKALDAFARDALRIVGVGLEDWQPPEIVDAKHISGEKFSPVGNASLGALSRPLARSLAKAVLVVLPRLS
jgi:hypothetical protein